MRPRANAVLKIIEAHHDYFSARPRHLAWAMMQAATILHATHQPGLEDEKLMQEIGRLGDKFNKPGLLYDAFLISRLTERYGFMDTHPEAPLQAKPDKTLDEWVEMVGDDRYRYRATVAQSPAQAEFEILARYGDCRHWNERGFLYETPKCGTDESLFAGYTRAEGEIRPDINNSILALRDHPAICGTARRLLDEAQAKMQHEYSGGLLRERLMLQKEARSAEIAFQERLRNDPVVREKLCSWIRAQAAAEPQKNSLCRYSHMMRMPGNAHPSYIRGALAIARSTLADEHESEESRRHARAFLERFEN